MTPPKQATFGPRPICLIPLDGKSCFPSKHLLPMLSSHWFSKELKFCHHCFSFNTQTLILNAYLKHIRIHFIHEYFVLYI